VQVALRSSDTFYLAVLLCDTHHTFSTMPELEAQTFPTKYINRGRLVSLLKALYPSEHEDQFKVYRSLDTWIVEAPRPLDTVSAPILFTPADPQLIE
jgi:hypothetical protein